MPRIVSQRGETIVEVLVAIAVIGSVLGTAYAIVSRNASSYQQASEHTEALKIAEGQLEYLRKITPPTAPFCFDINGNLRSGSCAQGIDNRYNVTVTKLDSTFESVVTWDGVNGGADRVSLSYRIY